MDRRIRCIIDMLTGNPQMVSRHALASMVGMSPSGLSHLFKRETGVSLRNFFLEQRLLASRRLLEDTFLSVKEVSYSAGFSDPSNFSRAYKRRFGVPPGKARL